MPEHRLDFWSFLRHFPGDPTIWGWSMSILYLLVAILAMAVAIQSKRQTTSNCIRVQFAWLAVAVVLLVLGANKQLDLQTAVRELGKWLAHAQGWYDDRSTIFTITLIASTATGSAFLIVMLPLLRRLNAPAALSASGGVVLMLFYGVRAGLIVHAADLFTLPAVITSASHTLECAGLLLITAGLMWNYMRVACRSNSTRADVDTDHNNQTVARPSIAEAREAIDL